MTFAAAASAAYTANSAALPPAGAPVEQGAATVSGIRLDARWKQRLYAISQNELLHPAWGWTHSERNYRLALQIAESEGLTIDPDVVFAAAFVHDIGAIGEFQKHGMDHAARSVEVAEPLLRYVGFPSDKFPAVREAILGHMHDKVPGPRNESIVFHDADTLDFLGAVGIARRLSVTGTESSYSGGVERIRDFARRLPRRLRTPAARELAVKRVAEMRMFLDQLDAETAGGRLP